MREYGKTNQSKYRILKRSTHKSKLLIWKTHKRKKNESSKQHGGQSKNKWTGEGQGLPLNPQPSVSTATAGKLAHDQKPKERRIYTNSKGRKRYRFCFYLASANGKER